MDTQAKRGAIKKKLNEYTQQVTPGQMAKLGEEEVNHLYYVYLGRHATPEEIKIYMNHPDNKELTKHLQLMRKDKEKAEKAANPQAGSGQGGLSNPFGSPLRNIGASMFSGGSVADPNHNTSNFHDALARGISALGGKINQFIVPIAKKVGTEVKNDVGNLWTNVKNVVTGTGMRTDRHNNPAAFTTDVAKTAGLIPGVDYTVGDAFPNNPNLHTARLIGDPIGQTIKVIDRIGFYTQGGKPRWTYVSQLQGANNWKNLNTAQKAQIIAQMYKHEGGSGILTKGLTGRGGMSNPQQVVVNDPGIATPGEFKNLGNITTQFGQPTRDDPFHAAVDIANKEGTPIPNFRAGTVTRVDNEGDFGNTVKVQDDQGNTQQYSHLRRAMVRPGQRVGRNQMIGQMGKTGNTYSPNGGDPSHLHYQVTDMYNRVINPANYLKQNQNV